MRSQVIAYRRQSDRRLFTAHGGSIPQHCGLLARPTESLIVCSNTGTDDYLPSYARAKLPAKNSAGSRRARQVLEIFSPRILEEASIWGRPQIFTRATHTTDVKFTNVTRRDRWVYLNQMDVLENDSLGWWLYQFVIIRNTNSLMPPNQLNTPLEVSHKRISSTRTPCEMLLRLVTMRFTRHNSFFAKKLVDVVRTDLRTTLSRSGRSGAISFLAIWT